jgi:hypothetical protein
MASQPRALNVVRWGSFRSKCSALAPILDIPLAAPVRGYLACRRKSLKAKKPAKKLKKAK